MSKNAFSKTSRVFKRCTSRKHVIKTGYKKVKKSHITKQLMHSFEVNIRICQPLKANFLRLTNPDVNKRIHQLYNVTAIKCFFMCRSKIPLSRIIITAIFEWRFL